MTNLSSQETTVLRVLRDQNNRFALAEDIARVTNLTEKRVIEVLEKLRDKGYVTNGTTTWYSTYPRWRYQWSDLEKAGAIAREYVDSQRMAWSLWPGGHCFVTSLLLAPLLRASLEEDMAVIVGVVQRHGLIEKHAWIEDLTGNIVDPTYGQFDGGPAVRVLQYYRADELGHWGDIRLTLAQEELYRNSIRVRTGDESGWDPFCRIFELFGEWPLARNAPARSAQLKRTQ
jgi:biotin operon repressor